MSKYPADDHDLIKFLQANAPCAPKIPRDLEDQIVGLPSRPEVSGISRPGSRWGFGYAVIGTLSASVLFYILWRPIPSSTSAVDAEELEQFVETSWDGTFADDGSVEIQYAMVDLDDFP